MASIDDSSADNDSGEISISMNALKDILYGIQIHPELNERYARLKSSDCIKKGNMNGNDQNSEQIVWTKVSINSSIMFLMN